MKGRLAIIIAMIALISGTMLISLPIANVKADPGIILVPTDYLTISAAITAAFPGDTIIVAAGVYLETLEISKQLNITGVGAVEVQGSAMFATHYGAREATIFVHDASNVVLKGLDVEGSGLGPGKSYAILYEAASGTVQSCIVSPNTIGDLNAVGIAAWDGSNLAVKDCIVKNFGRIGIFSNAATMDIERNTIIGQPYTGSGDVNYGIEIEDYTGPSTADIIDNEIYNCGNSDPSPLWSSCAILVDIWRYYEAGHLPSTVHIIGNNIHDNFEAIEIVGNVGGIVGTQYAHYNNIYDNLYGVWTDPDNLDHPTMFDAKYNWWGEAPPTYEDPALVDYTHYLTSPFEARVYTSPDPVTKVHTDIDSFFDVYVKIEKIEDLFGFDINITWDNTLVTFDNGYYNSSLNDMWGIDGWYLQQNTTGVNGNTGWYRLVALCTSSGYSTTGSQTLFTLRFKVQRGCNFLLETPLHFEMVKLSNTHWTPIPAAVDDGLYKMLALAPDLEFELVDPDSHPFEYCKTFQIKVYVTHICANLKDYTLTILYTAELLKLTTVDWTGGVLGDTSDGASFTEPTPGTITVVDTGGLVWNGLKGLLFTLTFHIEFDDRIEHIWRTGTPHDLTAHVSFANAELSFLEGTIPMSGIAMPAPKNIVVRLIRGDVDCDGNVDVFDIRCVANYYDQSAPAQYDLTMDGIIDLFDLVVVASNFGYPPP